MFTKGSDDLAFDSLRAIEGRFFVDPGSSEVEATIKMAYVDRASGSTYGECVVHASLFSKETIEALRAFLESAEKDFGSIVFKEGGRSVPAGTSLGEAESDEPPKPKSLGGV